MTTRASRRPADGTQTTPNLVLLVMASSVFLLSMLQTVVVPVLPQIGQQLHTSATAIGWITTSTMLTASALTPLFGRLGDVYGNKPVILTALTLTLAGSLLAATTHTITLLIVARVLQGASFGLFPLAISVLRREMPRERLTSSMAITASTLGVGGGVALVATGLLTQHNADYRRIFWLCTVLTAAVLVLAVFAIPRRAGLGGRVDYLGAVVLAIGLVALLLPLSQGHEWGWGSAKVIALLALSVVVLVGFIALQHRTIAPLVSTDLLRRGPVLFTNLTALCFGFAMFSIFLGTTFFVQSPEALAGFGFTASVLQTSVLFMLPGAVVSMFVGPVAGRLVGRIGPRLVLAIACAVGVVGLLGMAQLHANKAEVIGWIVVANSAIAIGYSAMPALLVMNVEPHETGIANSINSIMRTVGSSIGSALVVTILASQVATHRTPAGAISLPTEGAYRLTFLLGAGFFLVGGLLTMFGIRNQPAHPLTAMELEEDEALAHAGEFATASVDISR